MHVTDVDIMTRDTCGKLHQKVQRCSLVNQYTYTEESASSFA